MKWVIKNVTFLQIACFAKVTWRPLTPPLAPLEKYTKLKSWFLARQVHKFSSQYLDPVKFYRHFWKWRFCTFFGPISVFSISMGGDVPQTPLNIIKVDPLRVRNEQQKSQKTLGNGLCYWEPVDLLNFLLAANLFCLSNSVGGDKGSDSSAQTAEAAAITTPDS